jgi:dCTP diphosphatase
MASDNLENLTKQLAEFAQARDWEQFHNPKNLAMALIGEAGELVEHFQWLTFEQSAHLSPEKKASCFL